MTDNRTNEPTPEQVEAAAEGMWDRYGDRGMFQHAAEHLRSAFRKDARAALVAAAALGLNEGESGDHMEKSDLMGRFAFDGAEGIAFWIGDSDTEPITKVMFDELETLKAFIEHNLPGMFGAAEPDAATDGRLSQAELEDIAETHAFCADRLFIETELVDEIRAERDAAVATIERVRAVGESWRYGLPEYTSSTYQEGQKDQQRKLVRELLAALDGAPEPEWEYSVGYLNSDGTYSAEGEYDSDEITDDIDEARSWVDDALDSGTYSNVILMKRAPIPPWLPVEGKSREEDYV